ncbi:transmembrane protein 211-like [Mizuhopecten yessoensis]|uniref:Transmembrane protein 211 n=1 Tax=Mizuhopecten yessoensis TaxID=6573 RepID=A0A210PG86_MIZYE|nr:transmembrane protein 211-like [Mizuhopecten yessoensis]OWF35495.1 Transmembrane protein 211 [Mizuhopecten yessoensis]
MISFVFYIWILITALVAASCAFSLLQPFWILHPDGIHSFGVYIYCKGSELGDAGSLLTTRMCSFYGGQLSVVNIPSGAWQATFLLFSTGCAILLASLVLGLAGMFMATRWLRRLSCAMTYIQTSAVLILTSALIAYPLGMTSPFFRYYCGPTAEVYNAGQCSMGWSYMLAIMGTALSIFCPILWNLRDFKSEHDDYPFNL